jgi:hypothetical protein
MKRPQGFRKTLGVYYPGERLCTQPRDAERQAEHLFQSLLHRAFRGEL